MNQLTNPVEVLGIDAGGTMTDTFFVRADGEFGDKSKEELIELQHVVSIAGRILAKRGPFMSIQDMKGRLSFLQLT